MSIPALKRIKISTAAQLDAWLGQQKGADGSVMVVTVASPASSKHVSTPEVAAALAQTDWTAGRRYTLSGGLIGHVISLPRAS